MLQVIETFITASTESILLVPGPVLVHLLADERKIVYGERFRGSERKRPQKKILRKGQRYGVVCMGQACRECGMEEDSAEHARTQCKRWVLERLEARVSSLQKTSWKK